MNEYYAYFWETTRNPEYSAFAGYGYAVDLHEGQVARYGESRSAE